MANLRTAVISENSPLRSAIGIAWGLADRGRHADAATLCRACLGIWPGSEELELLLFFSEVELEKATAAQPPAAPHRGEGWRRLTGMLAKRVALAFAWRAPRPAGRSRATP